MVKGKGLIRASNRKGVESGKVARTGAGRVKLRGAFVVAHEDDIRRRIQNVAERAGHSEPARGKVSIRRNRAGLGLDVATPFQEVAHRIVRELKKTFHGEATYHWSDSDGSLSAVWEREE